MVVRIELVDEVRTWGVVCGGLGVASVCGMPGHTSQLGAHDEGEAGGGSSRQPLPRLRYCRLSLLSPSGLLTCTILDA